MHPCAPKVSSHNDRMEAFLTTQGQQWFSDPSQQLHFLHQHVPTLPVDTPSSSNSTATPPTSSTPPNPTGTAALTMQHPQQSQQQPSSSTNSTAPGPDEWTATSLADFQLGDLQGERFSRKLNPNAVTEVRKTNPFFVFPNLDPHDYHQPLHDIARSKRCTRRQRTTSARRLDGVHAAASLLRLLPFRSRVPEPALSLSFQLAGVVLVFVSSGCLGPRHPAVELEFSQCTAPTFSYNADPAIASAATSTAAVPAAATRSIGH